MISHQYDVAQSVLEKAGIDEYYPSFLSSMMRVKDHRDLGLWAQEVEQLITKYEGTDEFYSYDLWTTSIANREYQAAERFLSQMPGTADDPDTVNHYRNNLRYSIYTCHFLGKQEELALGGSELRSIMDASREPDDSFRFPSDAHDLAQIEVMEGNTNEAMRLVREWRRESFEEPSYLMPFIDPFLPEYDSIRDASEFVELLAEIDGAK